MNNIQTVPLSFDQYLVIYILQYFNSYLNFKGTTLGHMWLACTYFSRPNIIKPIYIQQMTEIILLPTQNTVGICNRSPLLTYAESVHAGNPFQIHLALYTSPAFLFLQLVSQVLTVSDPTSDLVRYYDFPLPLQCQVTSDTFFCCVCVPSPLSETVRRFSSCSTDFSQQIVQVVLFLFLGRPCVLM